MNYYSKVIKNNKELSKLIEFNEFSIDEINVLFDNPFFERVDYQILNGACCKNIIPKLKKRKTYCNFNFTTPLNPELAKKLLKSVRQFVLLYNAEKLNRIKRLKYQTDNSVQSISFLFCNANHKIQLKERIDVKIETNERIISSIYAVLKEIEKSSSNQKYLYLSILYYSYFDLEKRWSIKEIAEQLSYSSTSIKKHKTKAIELYCDLFNNLRSINYNDQHTKDNAS